MLDPVSSLSLVFASLQFVLQLKTYLLERKKRKQEEQQQQNFFHYNPLHASITPPTPIITYYCICTYNHIFPAPYPNYYVQYPAHHMHPPAPNFYPVAPTSWPHHNSAPDNYSRSVDANSSFPNHHPSLISSYASTPPYDWLGLLDGRMVLHNHQHAPISSRYIVHGTLGMRTGACAYNDRLSSYNHWKSLQDKSGQGIQSSIAVVDWSKGNIDMFMEIGGAYFRNYRISGCDVSMFAHLFKTREVFSGEIKEQRLQRFSKEMKMVEMRGTGVQSTNSWRSLMGIDDDSEDMQEVLSEQGSFIRTVRAAVFGLVCCLYEDPCDLNVDMETPHNISGNLDIVRINTHHSSVRIVKRDACIFSVFSFSDNGWAEQDILLG